MLKFKIGCDPEFFIRQYGGYKSAVGMIGGSKHRPLPIDTDGSAILEDNVSVEFNTKPAQTKEEFRSAVTKVLDHLREKLTGFEISQESAAFFPPEELKTPQALEFGCEPDYNAWMQCINPKPCAPDKTLRSCGGHVHVGSQIAKKNPIQTIKAMDIFLGVPSVELDKGTLRRSLYGSAGCFRFKPYGVEYRTLSNFWIFDSKLMDAIYDGTQRALEFVKSGSVIPDEHALIIQRCINTGNMDDVKFLKQYYGI